HGYKRTAKLIKYLLGPYTNTTRLHSSSISPPIMQGKLFIKYNISAAELFNDFLSSMFCVIKPILLLLFEQSLKVLIRLFKISNVNQLYSINFDNICAIS